MAAPSTLRILFRAAAGPRLGFGHVVRCRSLARALGVPPVVSLRATGRTRAAAARLGLEVLEPHEVLTRHTTAPALMVVDDPCQRHAHAWVARARRHHIPVAAIHDLGLGYTPSDVGIDGSLRPRRDMAGRFGDLRGPAYAVLDPSIVQWRDRRSRLVEPGRVLLALGGGAHVLAMAARLAGAIGARCPNAQLLVATGFAVGAERPALPTGQWITAGHGLGEELARAEVTVLAGGVTLSEACAIGTPAVALALTPEQGLTIRAVAAEGAALDAGDATSDRTPGRVAGHVAHLLRHAGARRRLYACGRALFDGRGAFRVADRLRALVQQYDERREEVSDAA